MQLAGGDKTCLRWTKFYQETRGKAAPATVKTLPPDWRFVLAEPYFKNLDITAAEAWILVEFLLAGPSASRATPDRVKRLLPANKWKATCELCRNPISVGGGGSNKCNNPFGNDCAEKALGSKASCPICAVMKKLITDVEKAAAPPRRRR